MPKSHGIMKIELNDIILQYFQKKPFADFEKKKNGWKSNTTWYPNALIFLPPYIGF